MLLLAALWAYLGLWSVLKPPLQAPDEVQHLMRATSTSAQPWVASPDWLELDERFINPLVLWPPESLGQLFFSPQNQLRPAHVTHARSVPWTLQSVVPATYWTPVATYPTGYYLPVFVAGEVTTRLLKLSPYQSTYAYRFQSVAASGVLWLLAYLALHRMPETRPRAKAVIALLLLNPVTAFVCSSVTPDAVAIPLATLAIVLTYEGLRRGQQQRAGFLALLACALTKPSGLLVLGSLIGSVAMLAWSRTVRAARAVDSIVWLGRILSISLIVFYAWSPPRFSAGEPLFMGLRDYAGFLIARVPAIWILYWGKLGWTDYQLPSIWFAALAGVLAVNAYCCFRRPFMGRSFAAFSLLVMAGYVLEMIIGEYHYVTIAGLNFQGRHLLAVGIGLSGLVMHDVRWARWTMLGYLVLLNALSMQLTLARYFGGDLEAWWMSLP